MDRIDCPFELFLKVFDLKFRESSVKGLRLCDFVRICIQRIGEFIENLIDENDCDFGGL